MIIDAFTDYTLLGSMLKPDALAEYAKDKWKFLGIADNHAGGLLDFYLECTNNGVKPILGLRLSVVERAYLKSLGQILLYAKNREGYQALLKIFSRANLECYSNGPNILVDWLPEHSKNLICVLPIGYSPNEMKTDAGIAAGKKLLSIFGSDLYFGLFNRICSIDDHWLEIAKSAGVKYLPLYGAKYFKKDDLTAYRAMRAIATRSTVRDLFELVYLDESLESVKQAEQLEPQVAEVLMEFVGKIDIKIPTPGLKVPKFKIPDGFKNSFEYLMHLCRIGYKERPDLVKYKAQIKERMAVECDVIKRCNLSDYFLLVYDICRYCDENGIPRGISRGSAGGCLISYLLKITELNPLEYNLLFERFLNEERTKPIVVDGVDYLTDAPDIDLDVGQIQRQQVIDFIREKYGYVSKIITYTTLSAKACIKDCIRVFGKSEHEANYVSSMIEILFGRADALEETYKKSEAFRVWVGQNQEIYDVALKLEDVKKNSSIHAAGIVVSDTPIDGFAPLCLANHSEGEEFKRDTCAAYSLDFAAKAGLLKVDILGIRSLNVLQDTIRMIRG